MASQNTASMTHTFQAHDGETLLSEVVSVRCILLPGILTITGYDASSHVLMIRHSNEGKVNGTWNPHFFEQHFLNEPLLTMPQQVKTIFIGSEHQLIVPDALYDEAESGKWLRSLYHLHPEDIVLASVAKGEEAHYMLSIPVKMQALLHSYFPEANVLPLAAYQLNRPAQDGNLLRCLIAGNTVMATLYNGGKLCWHQVFGYEDIADIAWQFTTLCREQQIQPVDLKLEATTLTDEDYDMMLELETFFPKIQWSGSETGRQGHWSPVIFLAQQLYQCAL